MSEVEVTVDEQAVRELFSDWTGPVGSAVQECVNEVEHIASGLAPVSPIGSKFAPRGFLRDSVHQSVEHHYENGEVIGLVGAARFPLNFLANPTSHKGFTYNARSAKHPGRVTVRVANKNFLEDALDAAPHLEIGTR